MLRILSLVGLVIGFYSPVLAEEGFESLFNGRDLTGWEGNSAFWKVEGGAITGTTSSPKDLSQNEFLIWSGGSVGNFELKLEFRLEGNNNSGVQYRSRLLPEVAPWVVGGYQADIHKNPNNLGMVYEERGRGVLVKRGKAVIIRPDGKKENSSLGVKATPVDLSSWKELTIHAQGATIVHKIDGEIVTRLIDLEEDKRSLDGIIALQIHRGPAMKVQFRNIRLKRLAEAIPQAVSVDENKPKSAATPVEKLIVPKDFQAELLYSVPGGQQGSWVSMCSDPQGRLIVSDQQGALYRIRLPGLHDVQTLQIEKIDLPIGGAQGMCWAFDSLYVVVNIGRRFTPGLYRIWSSQNNDQLDKFELLRELSAGGEHGPHAVLPGPDGKSLYVLCGNKTARTEFSASRVPENWDEDTLLPRIYGRGFMKGVPAPGGWVAKVDPDGKNWELVTVGFRNQYDGAFNADGELFTFDADMEWDLSTPWYRPTRLCQVLSGADYGWRNGSAKLPEHFADTPAPVVNIGPGSPTGVGFGYGAKFPEKYQKALFLCDWSYGKLYAAHLQPEGATYTAHVEEFLTGTPLPLTDLVINPKDGAMYFIIGGRQVQSGLYRVTYIGDESTDRVPAENQEGVKNRQRLRELQALHLGDHPDAVDVAWPALSSCDPVIREAARIAIEHRPVEEWFNRAINEGNSQARLESLLGVVRVHQRATRKPNEAVDDLPPDWQIAAQNSDQLSTGAVVNDVQRERQTAIVQSLLSLNWHSLTSSKQQQSLRVLQLALYRFGPPSEAIRQEILSWFDGKVAPGDPLQNSMSLEILVYLQSPEAAQTGIALLRQARTQEEEINYAKALVFLRTGWTEELRAEFFRWFLKAGSFRGGAGFERFITDLKNLTLQQLSENEAETFNRILDENSASAESKPIEESRPFVKTWTIDELLPALESNLTNRDYDRGRKMFSAANCFGCHRFGGEGGALGPDLTGLAGRFDHHAVLESIIDPDRVISDQYSAVQIVTTDGIVLVGRIVNHSGDEMSINTNMLDPGAITRVSKSLIDEMIPAKTSMMPGGLLNGLHEEEILNLMAFLLSRGDRNHAMFKKEPALSEKSP